MPRLSNIEKTIPTIYRRTALNQFMFAYVKGVRSAVHTVSVKHAITMFMEEFGLTDEDYNSDSAQVTFTRMNKELKEIL